MNPEKTPTTDTPKGGGRKALTVVGVLGAIAVNIAAFMLSADAITAVAEGAGISKTIAWALVLAVDGLMVTGTVVFIANRLQGRSVGYPLTVLGSGVLLSIICNALHAKAGGGHIVHLSSNAKMAVSAIPAVSLALSFHLIADMVKDSLGGHAKTVPAGASSGASVTASSGHLPSVSRAPAQTPVIASSQTPKRASVERPQTPRPTVPAKAKKTAAAPATDTRTEARKLLKADHTMNAAQLARALNKKPSGYMRDIHREVYNALADAGEIPRMRAIGA